MSRRIKYPQVAEFVERVQSTYPELPKAVAESLPSWIRQVTRRRRKLPAPLMYAIAMSFVRSIIAEGQSLPLPEVRKRFRHAMRIASKDDDQTTVGHLLSSVGKSPSQWETSLSQVAFDASARFARRVAAVTRASELSEAIRQFVSYLSQVTGYRIVPVRFDAKPDDIKVLDPKTAARCSIRAYTDGSTIHLPICLASTDSLDLNQAFLACYLTAHEYLHLAAGSYKFSFKSPRGRLLFRLLLPWRSKLKQRSWQEGLSYELRSKLQSEGIDTSAIKIKSQPDIAKYFSHFPNPSLAQWLFNAVEDGRLEALIERRWQGLWRIHRAFESIYNAEVSTSPLASTASQSLINAIGMFAADRQVTARLTRTNEVCYLAAKRIIQIQRELPRRSVYDSALTTRKLYLLLEKHFGNQELESEEFRRLFRPDVEAEEIAIRLFLAEGDANDGLFDKDGSPKSDDSYEVKEPGVWLPEWNGKELLDRRVHVKMHAYSPTKQDPQLAPLNAPFPSLNLAHSKRTTGHQPRWHTDGAYLATERLAEYRAQRRAGLTDIHLNYDLQRTQPALKVTLLFDLSISMEAPRHCLNGDTAIARAIQAGVWLATNLEAQGAEVEAYGGIDGGPKLCQLHELPKPVSRSIPSLRCLGAGGFRLGAFIRAISQSPPELGMKPFNGRHVVLVLTDGDGGYLATAAESVFVDLHKKNCPNCTSRHRCRIEHARGGINPRSSAYGSLFQSLGYAFGDIANAMDSQKTVFKLMIFNEPTASSQLDSCWGVSNWLEVKNGEDLSILGSQMYGASDSK